MMRSAALDDLRMEVCGHVDEVLATYMGRETEASAQAVLKLAWQHAKQVADTVARESAEKRLRAEREARDAEQAAKAAAKAVERQELEAKQEASRQAAKAKRLEDRARQQASEAAKKAAREEQLAKEREAARQARLQREKEEREAAMLEAVSDAVGAEASFATHVSSARRRRASARASSKGLLGRLRRGSLMSTPEDSGVDGRSHRGGNISETANAETFEVDLHEPPVCEDFETVEGAKRRTRDREEFTLRTIARNREAASKMDCFRLNHILADAGHDAKMDVAEYNDFRAWMETRDGAELESTLDPEDYAELYVELHEVYLLSDDHAYFVVSQRRSVQAQIDGGDWDGDEEFLVLHEELERLKRKTAEVGMKHEFEEDDS
eukprot:CAMPEP_0115837060 /NCGR_PEP_ID=MMETSP0287-20121206/5026_1 /TAXON_ID=412157 /ORGANISM="Chrysochromulina rotalis, Strain UIO044" /LENGTH=380 /DNA_ID=CAMNT_0003290559 /DNA_START=56 /DNA_END=1198 /DNA_ORIENTATION=+